MVDQGSGINYLNSGIYRIVQSMCPPTYTITEKGEALKAKSVNSAIEIGTQVTFMATASVLGTLS